MILLERLFAYCCIAETISLVSSSFRSFRNVCCLGLASESGPHECRSAMSVLQPYSSAASSVIDVDSKTAVSEVAASPQATAAVDVVASMHSYARPGYTGRPLNIILRDKAVGTASCEYDHKAIKNEPEATDTVEDMVSHHHYVNVSLYCSCIWNLGR